MSTTLASLFFASSLAAGCPVPDEVTLRDIELPHARAEMTHQHRLDILVLGGAATLGRSVHDESLTMSSRLQARLQAALPGATVRVTTEAAPHRTAHATLHNLEADLARSAARLVIWSAGGSEAGRGTDLDDFAGELQDGIDRIRTAGADVILMDLQYAPSIARIIDLPPYRDIMLRVGQIAGVPVLERYEMMRAWSAAGVLDLDTHLPAARVEVARKLFDCLAAALAEPIAAAVAKP